jgi:predicted aldo/keto reductase-like oxidoreductase
VGIKNPIICTNINKIGFRMCGGIPAYEALIAEGRCRLIAMSVFASGALPPDEALEYVCQFPQIQSILFGASSRRNIAQTVQMIERLSPSLQVSR